MTDTPPPPPAEPTAPRRRDLRHLYCLAIGVGAVLLGLLPWLVTGAHLPLQYLQVDFLPPEQMPVALLPFSQYAVTMTFGLLVVAYAAGAIVARIVGPQRRPPRGVLVMGTTIVVLHAVAALQASVATLGILERRPESALYLVAVLSVVLASVLIGVLVLALVATAPRGGALIGLAIAATAAGFWFTAWLAPFSFTAEGIPGWLLDVARWVPAVLTGAAIAWAGLRTPGRIVAAIGSLVLLWLGAVLATAISSAAGSYVLLKDPLGMVDQFTGVFRSAAFMPELQLPPLIVAVVIAGLGLVVRLVVSRGRARA